MLQTVPERISRAQDTIVLARVGSDGIDGISDYTRHLAESLMARDDVSVAVRNPRVETADQLVELPPDNEERALTLLLQYNPFSFGRWGFAPWLPAKLWRLRRSSRRVKIALMVHEPYVPIYDWRTALMGAWQRFQLLAVRVLADVVFASITVWASELAARRPSRPTYHLPVGSNLPDMRHTRAMERKRLGADDETLILAAFGTNHPSRLLDYLASAARAVASEGVPTILLNLGSDVPAVDAGPGVDVRTPGRLESEEIARYLAAADVFVAPFSDGISTRRTTVMAALQHALPVVSTDGALTDPGLRQATAALTLTPVGDPSQFARAASELALDPGVRRQRGLNARSLYEREFDWPVLSARLIHYLS